MFHILTVSGCLIFFLLRYSTAFHIDVVPKDSLYVNGHKVTVDNLHQFLEPHEKILLFGNNTKDHKFKIVSVKHMNRSKRSHEQIVNFRMGDSNKDYLQLKFNKSENLIDNSFVYINRYENSSVTIKEIDKVAANEISDCFFNNQMSIIDICNRNLRGILHNNLSGYLIHRLPERFGEMSHILIETQVLRPTNRASVISRQNVFPLIENVKEDLLFEPENDDLEPLTNRTADSYQARYQYDIVDDLDNHRLKRYIPISSGNKKSIPHELHVETAVFVDKDLYRHMAMNFPIDTESNLIRFVLAMINGVQLLYHHPSLGYKINFVLKRLEILHSDPKELRRSSDIDIFLNSFCLWQKKFNPILDTDAVHFDHAVILTGLDLYVVSKNGKVSSQVVGLAPVGGMCTASSSCTINEGKHFESVFVVAHEIGHNLGMRHDTSENNCDPSLYIMSPTLGSGKITWSQCSRKYLQTFLETTQANCLFDRGQFASNLDHSAEGILPGERFDANQQCMLKYGKDSVQSSTQPLLEICRDLHCQRDRYTWTSHPALEGTNCGDLMWCKSGICTTKRSIKEQYSVLPQASDQKHQKDPTENAAFQIVPTVNKTPDRLNFIENFKYGNLKHEYNFNRVSLWSDWSKPSECESGCLYGESGRLSEGSTGLKIYSRTCLDYRRTKKKCHGLDRKYESCSSKQCYSVPRTTILDFANQICERAKQFNNEILQYGLQEVKDNPEDSCKVYCKSKNGNAISKGWTYPDGTTCRNVNSELDDSYYCINGRCEKFTCNNSSKHIFRMDPNLCPQNLIIEKKEIPQKPIGIIQNPIKSKQAVKFVQQENGKDYKSLESIIRKDLVRDNYKESDRRSYYGTGDENSNWRYKQHDDKTTNEWIVKSGCHFSCMEHSKGIQIVQSKYDQSSNIQLCEPSGAVACEFLQTTFDYSTKLCTKYQLKVRGLSGYGMQISQSVQDPDRSCKVGCQDIYLLHRFYLVNGENGYFPFGTKCSPTQERYCVKGKCLEFGSDNIPLSESYINLALYRQKRELTNVSDRERRMKRHFLYYSPVNITERISQEYLQNIIANIHLSNRTDSPIEKDQIDFNNPVYVPMDEVDYSIY